MNTKLSLKSQVAWLSTGLILLTVMFLTTSNWLKFADYAETQIEQQIFFAQNVLDQTLNLQEKILTTSASVLTADFGFKQAVATQDKNTIKSVLLNHGKRINADLMLLLDLDGHLLSSSSHDTFSADVIERNISKLPFRDVYAQILSIENKVFQVIVVPVKAPRVIAYTIIGFEFNRAALLQYKDLIALEVSLVKSPAFENRATQQEPLQLIESSIEDDDIKQQALLNTDQQSLNLLLNRSDYYHKKIPFSNSKDVHAILSASLIQIHDDFNQLIFSILTIALIVIILAIVFSRLVSRSLSLPLKLLMTITKNIGRGELEVPKLMNNLPLEFTDLYQGFVAMSEEIEKREQKITFQAERDTLTGLYTRSKILHKVSSYIEEGIDLVLITFNIKDFKITNDTIGINNADAILKEISNRINAHINNLPDADILATTDITNLESAHKGMAGRVNSDEFLICIAITHSDAIGNIIERLRMELERPVLISDLKINLTLFYGVCNSLEHGRIPEKLISRSAMAAALSNKEQTPVSFYQQGDDEAYRYKLNLIEELKAALDSEDSPLFMNYQPKLNIKTGKVDKLEALIRWINNKGDFVNPEVFVGLAEQSGLIVTLTHWVITHVVQQVDSWNRAGHHFKVSINLSAQDIHNDHFIDFLLSTLNQYNVGSNQITLELTERDLAENEVLVTDRLFHLKSLGFDVSVDDYGIGQSSLAKLKNLPVNELKIDKTFILTLDQSQQDQDIVSSTISLGHKLGLRVVAEGVENKASLDLLRQFNCDYAQGYYISRPVSAEKIIEWYTSYELPN